MANASILALEKLPAPEPHSRCRIGTLLTPRFFDPPFLSVAVGITRRHSTPKPLKLSLRQKHGRVHIATPCKTVTESHHVWSARRQDLFRSSFSRASVSRAPRCCDRNKGGDMARRTVSPTRSPLLAQQNSLKLHNLHYHYLPGKYYLFRKAGCRIGRSGRRHLWYFRIIVASRVSLVANIKAQRRLATFAAGAAHFRHCV